MVREQKSASQALPVRPVPSLKPRDPAVDAPDYILMSASRLDDLIDFLIKNKVRPSSRCPRPRPSLDPFLPLPCLSFPSLAFMLFYFYFSSPEFVFCGPFWPVVLLFSFSPVAALELFCSCLPFNYDICRLFIVRF
jgi:hypothetical protein